MDYTHALGAEFHEVGERMQDGKPARVVKAFRTYPTDQDDLWDALTNSERIPRWFLPIEGDLCLGGHYQLEKNAGGTITRCDVPKALDLTWEYEGNVSWVSIRLEPDANGTRLILEHLMLKDEASEAHWTQYGPGATGVGWDLSFLGLGLHVENDGKVIDRKAEADWMASEHGKSFIRNCAEAWGNAHMSAGENSKTAHAMASHTANFYTAS